MKYVFTFVAALICVISLAQMPGKLSAQIDDYMNTVALKDGFTGTLVVKHNGHVVFQKGYGFADQKKSIENTPRTIHNLGSAGSIFTELAIMKLKDEGKLSLSNSVCDYLPECPSHWKKISVRNLLEQKSGLADYLSKADTENLLTNDFTREEMLARFAKDSLQFLPGEKFNSGATGYYLLGLIIEKVTGQPQPSFLKTQIFEPLGMDSTLVLEKGSMANSAQGYVFVDNELEPAPFVKPSLLFGYGNLYSTANDILAWESSLHANKLLSKESIQQIDEWTRVAGFGDKSEKMHGRTFRRYYKGTWGHRMHMLRFPSDSTTILILTNNNSTKQDMFMRDISAMIYGTYSVAKGIKEVQVASSVLQRYVGNYEFAPGREVAITVVEGKLHMQGTNRPRRELVAVSDKKFYIKGADVFLVFSTDELTLHEISATIKAKRKQ